MTKEFEFNSRQGNSFSFSSKHPNRVRGPSCYRISFPQGLCGQVVKMTAYLHATLRMPPWHFALLLTATTCLFFITIGICNTLHSVRQLTGHYWRLQYSVWCRQRFNERQRPIPPEGQSVTACHKSNWAWCARLNHRFSTTA